MKKPSIPFYFSTGLGRHLAGLLPALLMVAGLVTAPIGAWAQLELNNTAPKTENFDVLGTSATATVPAYIKLSGEAAPTYGSAANYSATSVASNGGTNTTHGISTGGTYNFLSVAGSTDRALGFLNSGSFGTPRSIMLAVSNTTGATIQDLQVQFNLEKYRSGTREYNWTFYTSPDGATWTAQNAGAQNYPSDANNTTYSAPPLTIAKTVALTGVNLAKGDTYYLRWSQVGVGGTTSGASNGQASGLDDVTLTPTLAGGGTPTPTTSISTGSVSPTSFCVTSTVGSSVSVAFTSMGTFTGTFRAQLSDATGAFPASATANLIGSGSTSPLAATIPAGTPSGTGYRIRVLNEAPLTLSSNDNGSNLSVTVAPSTNAVTVDPRAAQSFAVNGTGIALTASPTVASSIAWLAGTSATGPFSTTLPSTSATYQPKGTDFSVPGTYYVVAQATSSCGNVVGTSNAVQLVVVAAASAITASTTSLADFGSVPVGSASGAKSFTVGGNGLTGDLTITPAPGFEIRTGQTPFACCVIVLSPKGGSIADTQIDVRFAPQLAQVYTGKLTVASPGLTGQEVAVSGTGTLATYPATVSTVAPAAITTTTATSGGTVLDNGGSLVTAYGVAYGLDSEPIITGAHTTDGSGQGAFTSSLTGLRPGLLYYVRAYATNAQGTSYGEQLSFTTVAVPLAAEPTTSSTLTASAQRPTRVLLTFTGGTGAKHLVLAHLNGLVNQDPADATTYTASSTFGQGSVLGPDADNYVVFAGVGDTVTIFGLRPNTPYSFAVYDYNDDNTAYAENYRTSDPGVLSLTTPALPPTVLLLENFVYAANTPLTANNWTAHSGAGTKPFTVTSGSLAYPGYGAFTGNATAFTGNGEDVNRHFATIYARTPVYVSFLVSVQDASAGGDYFLHLGSTAFPTSSYRGRLFARKVAGALQFGVAGSGTAVYATTSYAFNTTYLLVLRYTFDETGNETALFVNPTPSSALPTTPEVSAPEAAGTSATDIGTLALRQSTTTPTLALDGIVVATDFPLAAGTPLPVSLTQFTAQLSGRTVQLSWQTASEVNSDHFVVERSLDGHTFTTLQTLPAAGNSSVVRTYTALDAQAGATGVPILYYRLRSVDQNGTSAYSAVQAVALTPAGAGLALFPNPAKSGTTLLGAGAGSQVQVFDAIGRIVTTATADAAGKAELTLPTGLASGVYVVRTGSQAIRLLVN